MKYLLKPLLFGVFFICFVFKVHAQQIELEIRPIDSVQHKLFNNIAYIKKHSEKKNAIEKVNLFSEKLKKLGFISNTYNLKINDSIIITEFNLKTKIDFARIYYSENFDQPFLKNITTNFNTTYFDIPFDKIEETIHIITNYFEQKGNTFSEVSLTNLEIKNNTLTAKLLINHATKRTIDKIIVKGYETFPKKFYRNYFNIKPNTIFNTKTLKSLNNQLNTLTFVKNIKPPEVLFSEDSTTIYLYLEKKSFNKFNGIIGFSNKENSNKIAFTGNIDLELQNIFNKGEVISLKWRSSINENKLFKSSFFIPYIYNTKISPTFSFSIIKQDTTYTTIKTNIKLDYSIHKNMDLSALYRNENSNAIANNYNAAITSFKKSNIGVSYTFKNTKRNSPLTLELSYLLGTRKYNSYKENQKILEFIGEYSLPFNHRSYLFLKQQNEFLFSKNILENELYKIGGSSSIRGFDELAISASKYAITNIEYHYSLNEFSELYSITDYGYVENNLLQLTSQLYSLGIGYVFNTDKSSTNLSYAIGKTSKLPFEFNNSKIHLKITYFF